jgi:hypothetical protein
MMRFKQLMTIVVGGIFIVATISNNVSAISATGPDPADSAPDASFTVANSTYIPNADSIFANVYFSTNTGTKTVRIVNPDLCHPALASSDDRDYVGYANGSAAVNYYLQEISGSASNVDSGIGYVRTGASACTGSFDMNIAGSQLVLDANSGKYKARVYAKVNGGKDIAATFKVNIPALANNAGVVGMVAGQTTNVDIDGRKTSYANINLKFAPPCTWTDKDVTATWYDDDNNPPQAGIQPAEFLIWVVETDKTTGASSKIQLTSSKLVENGSTNTFYPRAGQGTGTFTFRAKDNKKYDWVWSRIYDNNALQFSLPFDSINYTTVCPPPVAHTLPPSH